MSASTSYQAGKNAGLDNTPADIVIDDLDQAAELPQVLDDEMLFLVGGGLAKRPECETCPEGE